MSRAELFTRIRDTATRILLAYDSQPKWVEQYYATLTPSPGYTKRGLQRKLRHAVLDTLIAYHYAPTRDLESLSLESLCIEADSLKRPVP
jgi:hypothetical protein